MGRVRRESPAFRAPSISPQFKVSRTFEKRVHYRLDTGWTVAKEADLK